MASRHFALQMLPGPLNLIVGRTGRRYRGCKRDTWVLCYLPGARSRMYLNSCRKLSGGKGVEGSNQRLLYILVPMTWLEKTFGFVNLHSASGTGQGPAYGGGVRGVVTGNVSVMYFSDRLPTFHCSFTYSFLPLMMNSMSLTINLLATANSDLKAGSRLARSSTPQDTWMSYNPKILVYLINPHSRLTSCPNH